ncbi:hypothetical protein [Aquabacterium sp.]|uniref:hypothetical protein n=1 Tax=Aquabacterium sp. TaxID=1872578 RepID=UPI002CC4DF05|nr:hypothetical protein [Aquabacterium sp.]HSW04969.1 hypothetical protein [Aquabacterium sp.]
MSLKKTDMVKNLAKKLDGKMKTAGIPQRFAQGSAEAAAKRELRASPAAPKLVPVACRLPADLVNRLRDRAAGQEGGLNAVMAQAVAQWLDKATA